MTRFALDSAWIDCPYCGEHIELVIDCSQAQQLYIEDCQVCCRPIHLQVTVEDDGEVQVMPLQENESYSY